MDRHYDTTFDTPPPRQERTYKPGHIAVVAIVFFSGPIFWALGNLIEWAFYNPTEMGYLYWEVLPPLTQDRIARYWPWAVRVTLAINIMLGFAAYLILRQRAAKAADTPASAEARSFENWLIKITGAVASALIVVFFWVSAAAVGYLVIKNLFFA
ncbi:MAG: hypothetical protein AAFR00_02920 [Pseudomonadota bacterium]